MYMTTTVDTGNTVIIASGIHSSEYTSILSISNDFRSSNGFWIAKVTACTR
jgi:hypothetical protein